MYGGRGKEEMEGVRLGAKRASAREREKCTQNEWGNDDEIMEKKGLEKLHVVLVDVESVGEHRSERALRACLYMCVLLNFVRKSVNE